ncbi:YxeA family protein [Lactovum odontotermitis]
MKKLFFSLSAVVLLIAGGIYGWKTLVYGGTTYYSRVVDDGKKSEEKFDNGETFYLYNYGQKAYQKDGSEKVLNFTADHSLRKDAYLKITYNKSKGVTDWREVQKSEISAAALAKIEANETNRL